MFDKKTSELSWDPWSKTMGKLIEEMLQEKPNPQTVYQFSQRLFPDRLSWRPKDLQLVKNKIAEITQKEAKEKLTASEEFFLGKYAHLIEDNRASGRTRYQKAIDKGGGLHATVGLGISLVVDRDVTEQDKQRGLTMLTEAAEKGDAEAESFLGSRYLYGLGVAQNIDKGISFIKSAAEEKHPGSLRDLALAYSPDYKDDRGVQRNEGEALKFYMEAALQGDPTSLRTVGNMYYSGTSLVKKDEAKATEFFRKAIENGSDISHTGLKELCKNSSQPEKMDPTIIYHAALAFSVASRDHEKLSTINNAFAWLSTNEPELFDALCAKDLAKDPDFWDRFEPLLGENAELVKARQANQRNRDQMVAEALTQFGISKESVRLTQEYDRPGMFRREKKAEAKAEPSQPPTQKPSGLLDRISSWLKKP